MLEMGLIGVILFGLCCMIEWCMVKAVMDKLGVVKLGGKVYWILWVGAIIFELGLNLVPINDYIKVTCVVLGVYIFSKMAYHMNKMQRGLGVCLYLMIVIVSECIGISIGSLIFGVGNIKQVSFGLREEITMLMISRGALICSIGMIKYMKSTIRHWQKEIYYLLGLIGMNIFVLFFIFETALPKTIDLKGYSWDLITVTLLVAVANVMIVVLMIKFNKAKESELALKHYENRMEQQYQYYTRLEKDHEKVRILYHDMNNHLVCIKALSDDKVRLAQYIDEVAQGLCMDHVVYNTGSPVVDTILRGKSTICQDGGIALKVNLDLRMAHFISDKDLCSLVANALDNAIEACQKMTAEGLAPSITIEGRCVRQFLVIQISNTKDQQIQKERDKIYTNKKDRFYHGLGLTSMQSCVSRYEGEMNISYTEHAFCVKIMFPIPQDAVS
ncbi:MAG: GHKL domain-containing protein [Cellulosilyticaceae bacterium]